VNTFTPEPAIPPINFVITKIENVESQDFSIGRGNQTYLGKLLLIDFCGERYLYYHSFFGDSNLNSIIKLFVQRGISPVSYSVSIITEQKKGVIPLRIFSHSTDFEIYTKSGAVEEVGKSKNLIIGYEQFEDIHLNRLGSNNEAIMEIIPLGYGDVDINCVEEENCYVKEENTLTIAFVPNNMNTLDYTIKSIKDTTKYKIPLPFQNSKQVSVYELNKQKQLFEKISSQVPFPHATVLNFENASCNEKGKIYVKPFQYC